MGFRGQPFTMLKFRTMRQPMDEAGRAFTEANDTRITRVGAFLAALPHRRTAADHQYPARRDELDRSAPRGHELAEWYESKIPFYSYRHIVRPGITGWAQVNQGNVAEIKAATGKLHYDFYYIKYFSPWLDLLIAAKTMRTILTGSARARLVTDGRRRYGDAMPSTMKAASGSWSPAAPASSARTCSTGCSTRATRSSASTISSPARKRNIEHLLDHPRFEFMRHDVTFPLYVEVDEIYNLACPASPVHYQHDPVQTTKTSVHGAINMLGLAKRLRCRILQASTSEVYGDPEVHPQREDYWGRVNPIGPRSCYDEGKRCAETLFFDYHRQHGLRDQGGAHLQHLRAAHAPERRARGVELHRPGAARRADHHLWRRQPDALVLLCRRSGRRPDPADGEPGRFHRAGQSRQSGRVHHPASWPTRSSR